MYLLLGFSEHDLRFLSIFGPSACPKEWFASKSRNRTPEISLQVLMDILSHHNLTKRQEIQDTKNRGTEVLVELILRG